MEIDNILRSLCDLDGVYGAMVGDTGGRLLAFQAKPVYDSELLGAVCRNVVSAMDPIKLVHEDWEQVNAQFSDGRLIIRNIPEGKQSPALFLIIIADAQLNLSFAVISIRVAVGKIRAAADGTRASQSTPMMGGSMGAVPRPVQDSVSGMMQGGGGSGMGTFSQSSHGMSSAAFSHRAGEVAASGLSWSGLAGSSSMSGSGVSVTDPASSHFLTACTKALAYSVGPMAKVLVKEAVRRVCPDVPFSKAMGQALITELEKGIANPAEAKQFRANASKAL